MTRKELMIRIAARIGSSNALLATKGSRDKSRTRTCAHQGQEGLAPIQDKMNLRPSRTLRIALIQDKENIPSSRTRRQEELALIQDKNSVIEL
jgi:hypothetical protein